MKAIPRSGPMLALAKKIRSITGIPQFKMRWDGSDGVTLKADDVRATSASCQNSLAGAVKHTLRLSVRGECYVIQNRSLEDPR